MLALPFFKRRASSELRRGDVPYIGAVDAAQVIEPAPAAVWAVYLMLAAIATAITWAWLAQIDIIAKANARVVPDGREQVIASLEGGILRELLVREGQQVVEGQALAMLDPTRVEAQQAESQSRRLALQGALARAQAEAFGKPLKFPPGLPEAVVDGETENHQARQHALNEAVETNRRSIALLGRELAMAESMSAKGLMSEVEVMRVRRQVNDLNLQTQERVNRFRQEASAELVRLRNELAAMQEQQVVRDDALRRTTLISPVRGIVKQIRANTLGGVVGPGVPVMELLPIGARVLVEARVKPADIGFVKVGQPVQVKLTAYEYTIYGGLTGTVISISPDAMGDPDKAGLPEGTWYRAMVRADGGTLQLGERQLAVLPGMTGTVEIRTGQRSVLGFVLRPLLKSQEAFRER
ncbi:HlyD family efflux transporter periplasmic adaptor subunit [Rubrivivax sp. A210]|uniref:HlyD family efflux transporter periplasmic adaptor subunit n=1 Tax=Rubrivivax sp. A210 TaxID=2772301 RepID=UPI001F1E8437|nr:HlyD family efflux transporter periplasmic adaptor subunit [Rubrivivax sp. A210]